MTLLAGDNLNIRDFPLRVGLVGTGLILFGVSWDLWAHGPPFHHPLSLGLSVVAWVSGMLLIILAAATPIDSRSAWLILGSLLLVILARAYIHWTGYSPLTVSHNDNEMIAQYAVQALKRGHNPYQWNFADIARVFRDRGLNVTPFLDGAFQNRVTYPALPTLILTAFDLLGVEQVGTVNLLFLLILLVLVFVGAPTEFRPILLLPLFISKGFMSFALNGTQDIIWSTLLVGVCLTWKRPIWRAVLFGLASAYRQQPWFVAPFLLIVIWNEAGTTLERRRRTAYFVGISAGVFALVNLPFVLWDFRAWWLGVFEPLYAPFNVYSYGLGALSVYGYAPFPRGFYTGLQVSSFLIMLVIHWRHPRSIGQAFWIFPGIFFWLYYRSLPNYWIYWIPPLLLASIKHMPGVLGDADGAKPALTRPSQWMGTATFAAFLLVLNLLWGVALLQRQPSIKVSYSLPLEVADHGSRLVGRVGVDVTNRSDTDFVPRFAVQYDRGGQALPWAIDSGPERLRPGQSGEYVIEAGVPVRGFPVEAGGQIVVTDMGGDYRRRVVLSIPADASFTSPDLIVNPAYVFWPDGGDSPESWSLQTPVNGTGVAGIEQVDGKSTLMLRLETDPKDDDLAVVRLTQRATFPPEFVVWVYPTVPSTEPLQQAYGLELDDGENRLWILFGDSDSYGSLDENFGYVYLPSPLNTWSKHTIRPPELYALFRWELPPFTPRHRNGLVYVARQTQVSLLVASRSQAMSVGVFGPIEQDDEPADPDTLMAEILAHPDVYYVNLGDEYRQQRNYNLAQDAYLEALDHNSTSAEGCFGLAEASFWRDDWTGAIEAFEKSILYGYRHPARAYRGMGWAYYNLGELDRAEHAFEEAVQADPGMADAYNGLGWVWLQDRRCDRAIPYFEQALALAPDFPDPQRGIEKCTGSQ